MSFAFAWSFIVCSTLSAVLQELLVCETCPMPFFGYLIIYFILFFIFCCSCMYWFMFPHSACVFHACGHLLVHYICFGPSHNPAELMLPVRYHTILTFIVSAKGLQLLLWHCLYLSVTFSTASLLLCLSLSMSLGPAQVFCGNEYCTPNLSIKNKIL